MSVATNSTASARGVRSGLLDRRGLDSGRLSATMKGYPLVVLSLCFLLAYHSKAVATRHARARGTIRNVPTDILICGMLESWGACLAVFRPLHVRTPENRRLEDRVRCLNSSTRGNRIVVQDAWAISSVWLEH